MASAPSMIVYPIFLECCSFTSDGFWENVFENLAYGIAPRGTYISKGFLRSEKFAYKIERKDPSIVYAEVYDLLTRHNGLISTHEESQRRKAFQNAENKVRSTNKNWSDIKKKSTREILIERFVIKSIKEHRLSLETGRSLLASITMAFNFKTIVNEDVVYENDQIVSIKGLDFSDKSFTIRETNSMNSLVNSNMNSQKPRLLSKYWPRYLHKLGG